MPSPKTEHAVALADHFIATVLEEDPELLVSSLEELEDDEIRDVARKFALFRLALIEELVNQPLGDEDELDGDDEDDDEGDD